MQQIHNGSYEQVELSIYRSGSFINADGDVLVTITDADTDYLFVDGDVATNLPPNGKYGYEITPDITASDCVLKINWSYQINGKQTSQNTFVQVITPYNTISEIIEYYGIGVKPSDLNYVSEQEMINAEKIARTQINTYTNDDFGKKYGTQEHFGNGSDALELIERMLTVDKLYENDMLVIDNTTDPVYNNFGYDVEITLTGWALRIKTDLGNVRYDNQVDPTIMYYGRFRDQARYKVIGEIGYNYVPEDIKICSMMLIGDYLSRDSSWRQKYLKKINLAEVSFELNGAAFTGTGNVIVDQILDQRRNLGIVVI